mgnify:CR=1 FL=1
MKKTITKILSIICLLGILACAFMPCFKLTGDYQTTLGMVNSISASIPEESLPLIEQLLEQQGITIDIKGTLDSFTKLLEPLNDGEITIMDFVEVSTNCTEVANALSGLPVEGLAIEEGNPMAEMLSGINEMVVSLAQLGAMLPIVSYILLIPVGLFGLLAFFVVLRIILRLFNRRGLGIGITFLALLNAGFMVGLPMVVAEFAGDSLPFGLESTNVPYIMIGCCIASCIIWAIGRGAKVKKVKEEAPVAATPVETTPVAPVASVEETPVAVEETATEAAEDEVLVDTELVEEEVEDETL